MISQLGNKDLILEIDSIIVLNFITSNTVILRALGHSHQLSHKKCHFDTPKTYLTILLHHFTIHHLLDVLFFHSKY